jgi:ABC-type oligopeptide transport system ATPase subunit
MALLNSVGISEGQALLLPRALSGGQRQRVSTARALAVEPSVLIADEPTSSIDQSAQAQLLNLLRELQQTMRLSVIFISHDLLVVRYLTARTYVMKEGEVVEHRPTMELFDAPEHPYTRMLVESTRIQSKLTSTSGDLNGFAFPVRLPIRQSTANGPCRAPSVGTEHRTGRR